jgi:hypothetical protein
MNNDFRCESTMMCEGYLRVSAVICSRTLCRVRSVVSTVYSTYCTSAYNTAHFQLHDMVSDASQAFQCTAVQFTNVI